MSAWLSKSTKASQLCRCHPELPEQLVSFFHTSSSVSKGSKRKNGNFRGGSSGSRQKLAQNLGPPPERGTVSKFNRESAPHEGQSYPEAGRPRKLTPQPTWRSERDRMSRTGKWGDNGRDESSRHATWRGERDRAGKREDRREDSSRQPARGGEKDRRDRNWADNVRDQISHQQAWRNDKDSRPGKYTDKAREEPSRKPKEKEEKEDEDADTPEVEFYDPPSLISSSTSTSTARKMTELNLPTQFTSPPLLPGLLQSLQEFLPEGAKPTPIQALSLTWVLETVERELMERGDEESKRKWRQYLLASETGSGKSIAYLLPVLQSLKTTEMLAAPPAPLEDGVEAKKELPLNPRALILAPTHELSRQLSVFAKALLHNTKLRVQCASKENTKTRGAAGPEAMNIDGKGKMSSRGMKNIFDTADAVDGVFEQPDHKVFPVDVIVGTPSKILEMVRGFGWNHVQVDPNDPIADDKKLRRGRDMIPINRKVRVGQPEMGLERVDWVVVDEADVLFDADFKEQTLNLLADVSKARGAPLPAALSPSTVLSNPATSTSPVNYPFHLLLTSATIPSSLINHLNTYHPTLTRLTSPNLHKLPKTLTTEYVDWTGGNKFADVERRIRQVWADDAARQRAEGVPIDQLQLSKVLVFANKSTKVLQLGEFLEQHNMRCVKMTSGEGGERMRGSNKPFKTFLKPLPHSPDAQVKKGSDPKEEPHVLLTTSLLSRGLDFAPEIKHVFIIDEPRNMIDFLHRAGRSGRAGNVGKVVIFGKGKGRGSERARSVRRRVRETVR